MKICLNGEPYDVGSGTTLAGLLKALSLRKEQVAVERNRKVVKGKDLDAQALQEGDRVEVVHFVGGG